MKQRNMDDSKKEKFDQFKYMEKITQDGFTSYKSQYDKTIKQLEGAFEKNNIYYGFYESLFNEQSFQSIQQFLGIPLETFDSSQVFNASPKSNNMPDELNKKLVKHFRPTYEAISERHGDAVRQL